MSTKKPVCRCVICRVTFLRTEDYLHPRHRCITLRHPSAFQPSTTRPAS